MHFTGFKDSRIRRTRFHLISSSLRVQVNRTRHNRPEIPRPSHRGSVQRSESSTLVPLLIPITSDTLGVRRQNGTARCYQRRPASSQTKGWSFAWLIAFYIFAFPFRNSRLMNGGRCSCFPLRKRRYFTSVVSFGIVFIAD